MELHTAELGGGCKSRVDGGPASMVWEERPEAGSGHVW